MKRTPLYIAKSYTYKGVKVLTILFTVLIAIIIIPYLLWVLEDEKPLNIFVIDKTVGEGYREHRSFFWLLEHWKYVKTKDHSFYDRSKDYYGYYPDSKTFSDQIDFTVFDSDLIYLVDTYGVYRYPMEYDTYERLIPDTFIPIQLKYGGITQYEIRHLMKADTLGKTIVGEFNILQNPTSRDTVARIHLERLFNITYTGILGKFYEDLADVSIVIKNLYTKEELKPWEFKGKGIVIIDNRREKKSSPHIVVLDNSTLQYTPIFLRTTENGLVSGAGDEVPYYYFFEFLQPGPGAKVAAYFEIRCNEEGKEIMRKAQLPLTTPAVITADASFRKVYFAGDFVDNDIQTEFARFKGIEQTLGKLYYFYMVSDQTRFFWRFYLPTMKNILRYAQQQKESLDQQ